MRKYLQFLKYAFKEQLQYRANFLASICTMVFSDACFVVIFIIFLWYFTNTWLTLGNFLVIFWISCTWYGIVHGLLVNISKMPEIIEKWKLDYYLSFPIKPLNFLAFTNIDVTCLWDIVFGTICLSIYAFSFAGIPVWIVLLKGLIIISLSSIIVLWIYTAVWSISFWLQKWSKIQELFVVIFLSFAQYPPEIYEWNRIVYILMCLLIFPWIILPYKMMTWTPSLIQRIILIWFAMLIPLIWIRIFKRGLKRYSSWNLVHQM